MDFTTSVIRKRGRSTRSRKKDPEIEMKKERKGSVILSHSTNNLLPLYEIETTFTSSLKLKYLIFLTW